MVVAGLFSNSRFLRSVFVVLLTVGALGMALSAGPARAQEFVDLPPELDARAADLYDDIMCPVCNGQTISQSNSANASTMRQMVRQRLLAGDTDEEILSFMSEAFGDDILASPPTSGFGLAVWVIPPAAILAGGVVIAFIVRSLKQRQLATAVVETPSMQARSEMDSYLRMVDQEMGEKT